MFLIDKVSIRKIWEDAHGQKGLRLFGPVFTFV
jgi:hypothetical protein